MELIEKFSVEGFRYYFMSQCPFGGDGEFSFERFADAYNSGLANNLGNLYSRILTMCLKYFDGRLEGAAVGRCNAVAARARPRRAGRLVCAIRSARSTTVRPCSGSGVTSSTRPTATSRRPSRSSWPRPISTACRAVLVNLADWLRVAAILIKPFLPRTAETFYRAFNFEEARGVGPGQLCRCGNAAIAGRDLNVTAPITGGKPAPLFPKIDAR